MSYLVISTSLNPNSKSYLLAREAEKQLTGGGRDVDFLDLRKLRLPLCDGSTVYSRPAVAKVRKRIQRATSILVGVPIYNYDCGSAAKNLVELTGDAWKEKTVGFLCAAGGRSSYMSIMGLANSLMLDFRCLIVPRFVYADDSSFAEGVISDAAVTGRIAQLVASTVKLDGANLDALPNAHH